MKEKKRFMNIRWWVVTLLLSPVFLCVFIAWLLAGIFEILGDFFRDIVDSPTPKWIKKAFDWSNYK